MNNNKPSWDDAPEWANYLAMDCRGAWYWFEKKPIRFLGEWAKTVVGSKMALAKEQRHKGWHKTLTKKPKTT